MAISVYSKGVQRLIDGVICVAAWVAAYQIQFEGRVPPTTYHQMLALALPVAAGQVGMSSLLGVYRYQWRYISGDDAPQIARAYACFFALLLGVRLLFGSWLPFLRMPGSILVTSCVLAVCGGLGVRLARRLDYQRSSAKEAGRPARRFVVVGAGIHGATVVREMILRKGIEVVGFVDDDPGKQGAVIAGVKVLGRTADLAEIVKSRSVDEVLVCISPKSRQSLPITNVESSNGLMVYSRIIPTLDEVLDNTDVAAVHQPSAHFSRAAVDEPPGTDKDEKSGAVTVAVPPPAAMGGNGNGKAVVGQFLPAGGGAAAGASVAAPVI